MNLSLFFKGMLLSEGYVATTSTLSLVAPEALPQCKMPAAQQSDVAARGVPASFPLMAVDTNFCELSLPRQSTGGSFTSPGNDD